jgi:hypothetical protein
MARRPVRTPFPWLKESSLTANSRKARHIETSRITTRFMVSALPYPTGALPYNNQSKTPDVAIWRAPFTSRIE